MSTLNTFFSNLIVKQAHAQGISGPQPWTTGADACAYQGTATIRGIECIVANVLSVAITLLGLAGLVMMILGAFRYLISGGNSKETETARNTLTYAVIGLVVGLASFVILNLIAEFTGVKTILDFSLNPNS